MSVYDFLTTFLTGAGLAMDAFAVAVADGISCKYIRFWSAVKAGLFFGFFQFLMPMAGFFVAGLFASQIRAYDHIVALIILSFLGGKMIYEAMKNSSASTKAAIYLSFKTLIPQAFATSIDALAVGVTYSVLSMTQTITLTNCIIIGIITFVLSTIGVLIGRKLGTILRKKASVIGGVILILIGIKIFISDLI